MEGNRHLSTAKWPRTHYAFFLCVFVCHLWRDGTGGMGRWQLWGSSLAILSPSLFLSCDRHDKALQLQTCPPSCGSHFQFSSTAAKRSTSFGMTSSASENAGWADLLQLYSCPVWEDQWGVQNVHFSSLPLKWQLEVPRAKVHTWTCLWRVSRLIQSVLSSRSFSFWKWLVCLWAGRDGKCCPFQ